MNLKLRLQNYLLKMNVLAANVGDPRPMPKGERG